MTEGRKAKDLATGDAEPGARFLSKENHLLKKWAGAAAGPVALKREKLIR